MQVYIEPIGRLINEFSKLPGVGKKSAQRYAYKIIDMSESDAREFAAAILDVKRRCATVKCAATSPKTRNAISANRETGAPSAS